MAALESIEAEILRLPHEAARELQEWLADYLDDQEVLSSEFESAIERGKSDIANGASRTVVPERD